MSVCVCVNVCAHACMHGWMDDGCVYIHTYRDLVLPLRFLCCCSTELHVSCKNVGLARLANGLLLLAQASVLRVLHMNMLNSDAAVVSLPAGSWYFAEAM